MLLTPVSLVDSRRNALYQLLEEANSRSVTSKEFLRMIGEKLLEIHAKLTNDSAY